MRNLFGGMSFFQQQDVSEADRAREEHLQRAIGRADAFRALRDSAGWKILTQDMAAHIEVLHQQLREADEMKEVRKLQVAIKEAELWSDYVENEIATGESAARELREARLARAKETA